MCIPLSFSLCCLVPFAVGSGIPASSPSYLAPTFFFFLGPLRAPLLRAFTLSPLPVVVSFPFDTFFFLSAPPVFFWSFRYAHVNACFPFFVGVLCFLPLIGCSFLSFRVLFSMARALFGYVLPCSGPLRLFFCQTVAAFFCVTAVFVGSSYLPLGRYKQVSRRFCKLSLLPLITNFLFLIADFSRSACSPFLVPRKL